MTLSADIPPIHHASSPELVVINDFYVKPGASVGAEQLLTQLAAFTLVTVNLCRLPVFVHRVDVSNYVLYSRSRQFFFERAN